MLVLVYPMFSRTALNADSCYVVLSRFIREAVRTRPDIMFDVLWPSNGKDWSYFRDGLFDLPNVRRLPLRFHPAKIKQVVAFCPFEVGEYLDYKVPYDVVWNHAPEIGDLIKNNVASYNPSGKSAVVNVHEWVLHKSLPYPVEMDQSHVLLRQLVGGFNVDAQVFISQRTHDMYFENVDKYLAPMMREHLEKTAHVIPHGVLDPLEFDPLRTIARAPTFTFAYNHRLQHYKRYKTTFEQFERLHAAGVDFRVTVFGMPEDQAQMSWVSKYPFADIFISQTREAYLAKLAECHANVSHSSFETFCIAAVESMAMGQALIAGNRATFPEITGRLAGTNYELLFDNDNESYDMMYRLATSVDEAAKHGAIARAHVWEHYNVSAWANQHLAVFDQVVGRHDVLAALKNPEPMIALVTSRRQWEFQELRREVYQLHHDGKLMASAQSFPANRIKRMMHQLGYHDARAPRTKDLLLVKG